MATTMSKVAEDFGYQLAFLKSDPELYSVFKKAVDGGWDATRFVSAVRATKWYKTHNETWRNNQQLRYTDPRTWETKVNETRAQVSALAYQMGTRISHTALNNVGTQAFQFGWSQDQIRAHLAALTKGQITGIGESGQVENAIRQTAYRNGVNISDNWIKSWVSRVQQGHGTIEDAQQQLRDYYGKQLAPGFAKELAAGQDLYDLASPYMQTMAKTLEISPSDVDLFDPTIRKALATQSDPNGQATAVPLWKFETDLRKDPRWMKTNNAREAVDSATRSLSQMFGLGV